MNKYDAAKKFCEMLSSHPDDFVVGKSEHRNYKTYAITHIKSGVAVRFEHYDIGSELKVIINAKDDINHVSGTDLKSLLDWAEARLIKDRVKLEINKDNAAIEKLLSYY